MRLQPPGIYARPPDLVIRDDGFDDLRISLEQLARVCERHNKTVAPAYSSLLSAGGEFGSFLAQARKKFGQPKSHELGLHLAWALRAIGTQSGLLTTQQTVEQIQARIPGIIGLAQYIFPLLTRLGAHVTATVKRKDRSRPVDPVDNTPLSAAARRSGIAFDRLGGRITADSSRLRHYAHLLSLRDRDPHREPADPSEAVWTELAQQLYAVYALGLDGYVQRHGDIGRIFIDELAKAQSHVLPEPPNWEALAALCHQLFVQFGDDARPLIDLMVRGDELIPRSIPELDLVKAQTPDDAFHDVAIAGIQHLLPSTVALIEAYIDCGASPQDIWLLAKDYTNNPLVITYLRLLGINVMNASEDIDGTYNVTEARARDVEIFTETAAPAMALCRAELILDDGAALIEHLNAPNRFAVELTTKGHNRLRGMQLQLPVVSIALTPHQIDEGEVIGEDIAQGLLREIRWQKGKSANEDVVAVGLGTIGLNFLATLQSHNLNAVGFDTDKTRRKEVQSELPEAKVVDDLQSTLPDVRYAVLISNAGHPDPKSFAQNGVRLASGSSHAIEVDESRYLEADLLHPPLNAMRPLNFVRTGHETLSHRQIGLTRAAFFEACVQVMHAKSTGQQELQLSEGLSKAAALWQEEGRSIRRAHFTGVPKAPHGHAEQQPTHDEWMRFFLGGSMSEAHAVMVRPIPSAVNFAPQPYLYRHQSQWNLVDTRIGKSHKVQLPNAPAEDLQLLLLGDSGPGTVAALTPTATGCHITLLGPNGSTKEQLELGTPLGFSARRHPDGTRFVWFFQGSDGLQALSAGSPPMVHHVGSVDLTPSTFALVGDDAVLQTTKTADIYVHSLSGHTQRIENHGLVSIERVSQPANRPGQQSGVFVVGADLNRRTVVLGFDREGMGRVVLPAEARFVGVDAPTGETPTVSFERDQKLEELKLPLS